MKFLLQKFRHLRCMVQAYGIAISRCYRNLEILGGEFEAIVLVAGFRPNVLHSFVEEEAEEEEEILFVVCLWTVDNRSHVNGVRCISGDRSHSDGRLGHRRLLGRGRSLL